jgi:hypothetical protein
MVASSASIELTCFLADSLMIPTEPHVPPPWLEHCEPKANLGFRLRMTGFMLSHPLRQLGRPRLPLHLPRLGGIGYRASQLRGRAGGGTHYRQRRGAAA